MGAGGCNLEGHGVGEDPECFSKGVGHLFGGKTIGKDRGLD